MKKVKLDIIGLSNSQTQAGAYALVLSESNGRRRLPIIIGAFEAQAIAIEMEKMTPTRPLTHDLFKQFAEHFNYTISEVLIYNLVEGVFFAKIICKQGDQAYEIDARTSDAIALAVRFDAQIYTYEFILASAGILIEGVNDFLFLEGLQQISPDQILENQSNPSSNTTKQSGFEGFSLEELESQLQEALLNEAYEKAALIRDEITKRSAH
ncbi:MAG: hypothetical protein EOO99_03020 [Pedobacter sp.]|nr:MAG: hypothetical protein EOO99_03020 [Pedobacter sp.]